MACVCRVLWCVCQWALWCVWGTGHCGVGGVGFCGVGMAAAALWGVHRFRGSGLMSVTSVTIPMPVVCGWGCCEATGHAGALCVACTDTTRPVGSQEEGRRLSQTRQRDSISEPSGDAKVCVVGVTTVTHHNTSPQPLITPPHLNIPPQSSTTAPQHSLSAHLGSPLAQPLTTALYHSLLPGGGFN